MHWISHYSVDKPWPNKRDITIKPGQAYPQDSINKFIIQKMNLLVVVDFRFISAFLHA